MITLKPLKTEDLEKLKKEAVEDIKSYPDFEPGEISFAGYNGDILIGAGGIHIFWEGVGEGWLMLSKNLTENEIRRKSVFLIRAKLNEIIEKHNLCRVQALIRTNMTKAISLVEAFGFEYEGTMRKYAPDGTDMMIYAKVK